MRSEEVETTIVIDYSEKVAHVWTNHPPTIRKLQKISDFSLRKTGENSAWFDCPIKCISLKALRKSLNISEEKREELAERFRKARLSK